jgi:hypothetical protein
VTAISAGIHPPVLIVALVGIAELRLTIETLVCRLIRDIVGQVPGRGVRRGRVILRWVVYMRAPAFFTAEARTTVMNPVENSSKCPK